MRTAVVILNWNTKNYLEEFLPGLIASSLPDSEVIVADSASTDGSMEMMAQKFPSVKRVPLDDNYGFTGGYNRAFKAVCAMPEAADLEYFVLINSDVDVSKDWLVHLVNWMDGHPSCAACVPKILSWHNKESFEYAGAAGGLLDRFGYPFCRGRVMKQVETDRGQYDEPAEIFWGSGACLMVRKSVYERLGGLDPRFFAHMEEIDLCWRCHLEGLSVWTVPQSVVWHIGGGTLSNDSPWKLELNFRNSLLMLQNNLAKTYALELAGRMSPRKAAKRACAKARRTIFLRRCLDGCSAMVYLLSKEWKKFLAVIKAHRGFRKMGVKPQLADVEEFVNRHQGISAPKLYPRWIVSLAILKGNGIFEYLRKSLS